MLGAALPAYMAVPAQAQIAIDVRVDVPPPPLPYYEQPPMPAEGYIWAPGYWAWDPAALDYYWVPGTWVEPPQPELLWTPAWWGWVDGRYGFHPGYWGREVGFYGGVDYGYGYTGEGYYGGRWDHGVFFYNRAVNNFANVRVTNIYNQTVIVNPAATRVSFNGGNGGIQLRPTPQQEAFGRERHIDATPVQRQHAEIASQDRSLFAKQNHGEPAVAATPRPGVLQGGGVTRASRTPVVPSSGPGSNQPQGVPQGHELPRPGAPGQPPAVNQMSREPQTGRPPEPPRPELREQTRPETPPPQPHVEERRSGPPPAPATREPPPPQHMAPPPQQHMAPPPPQRPQAPPPHPGQHEEERH